MEMTQMNVDCCVTGSNVTRCSVQFSFYQRVSIASYANRWYSQRRNVRLSVCLSVRLSAHSGIVSKRRKLASWFLHHPRARTF